MKYMFLNFYHKIGEMTQRRIKALHSTSSLGEHSCVALSKTCLFWASLFHLKIYFSFLFASPKCWHASRPNPWTLIPLGISSKIIILNTALHIHVADSKNSYLLLQSLPKLQIHMIDHWEKRKSPSWAWHSVLHFPWGIWWYGKWAGRGAEKPRRHLSREQWLHCYQQHRETEIEIQATRPAGCGRPSPKERESREKWVWRSESFSTWGIYWLLRGWEKEDKTWKLGGWGVNWAFVNFISLEKWTRVSGLPRRRRPISHPKLFAGMLQCLKDCILRKCKPEFDHDF